MPCETSHVKIEQAENDKENDNSCYFFATCDKIMSWNLQTKDELILVRMISRNTSNSCIYEWQTCLLNIRH